MKIVDHFMIRLHLAFQRHRILFAVFACLWLGTTMAFAARTLLKSKVLVQEQALSLLERNDSRPPPVELALVNQPGEDLLRLLIPVTYLQQTLESMQGIEQESGLALTNSSYRIRPLSVDKYGAVDVQFSTKTDFRTIQQFVEKLLLAFPFASVSELQIKRDNIQSNQIDVKCKITLYVSMEKLRSESEID